MSREPPALRSHCPIAYALDFVGDKWSLIVLRDLMMAGKRYFRDLLEGNEKIATNILSNRLRSLEKGGFIRRRPDPEQARRSIYEPTPKALDLLPVMVELVRWSAKYDAKTVVPPAMLRRMSTDRDGFIAELRARLR